MIEKVDNAEPLDYDPVDEFKQARRILGIHISVLA